MKVYIDTNDWWVGYYRGPNHHYVCPLPTVVVRWARHRRWQIVIVDTEGQYADCVTQTGPGWWCRVGARLSNWMLRPIPDFRYRYEARQEPR